MNRFLKGLDGAVTKDSPAAQVVAVWLTGDADKWERRGHRVAKAIPSEMPG